MSTICSKIDSIDRLWFEPITAKTIKVSKLTRVDNTIVALGTDGKIYTTGVISRVSYSCHGDDGKISRVLDGCIKLGALSTKAVRQHKEDVAKRMAIRDQKYAAKQLADYAERAGIELTAEQLAKIEASQ